MSCGHQRASHRANAPADKADGGDRSPPLLLYQMFLVYTIRTPEIPSPGYMKGL